MRSSSPVWITFEATETHSRSLYTFSCSSVPCGGLGTHQLDYLTTAWSCVGQRFTPCCRRKISQKSCLWGNGCPRWQFVERVVLLVAFCFVHENRHNHGRSVVNRAFDVAACVAMPYQQQHCPLRVKFLEICTRLGSP